MADTNARLISLEEHSRNCSSGEEPTRKKGRVHNPKIAETVPRLHNSEGNNRRYEPEQGLSSPHNEAMTSHLVAALTASPDMDGVDRGVLLLACKTYYETVRRNFRYSKPDQTRQRRKRQEPLVHLQQLQLKLMEGRLPLQTLPVQPPGSPVLQ
ncbi:hypothetical protein ABVT39_001277 [Epinephelus coioides]